MTALKHYILDKSKPIALPVEITRDDKEFGLELGVDPTYGTRNLPLATVKVSMEDLICKVRILDKDENELANIELFDLKKVIEASKLPF